MKTPSVKLTPEFVARAKEYGTDPEALAQRLLERFIRNAPKDVTMVRRKQ